VGFLIWNQAEKDAANAKFDDFAEEVASGPSGSCSDETCAQRVRLYAQERDEVTSRDVYGWVGVGVGTAVAALGAGLLIWGDDPHRYSPREESDVFGSLRLDVGLRDATLSGHF
jgi:hypothetical protein